MEDPYSITLCIGCLCSGRKLRTLRDFWNKDCFLRILSEMPMYSEASPTNPTMRLCWLCEAQLSSFTKFKHQVKRSYTMMREYITHNKNLTQLQEAPRLQITDVKTIDVTPESDDSPTIDNIKTEHQTWDSFEETKHSKEIVIEQTKVEDDFLSDTSARSYDDDKTDLDFNCVADKDFAKKRKGLRPKRVLNGDNVKDNAKLRKRKKKKTQEENSEVYRCLTLTAEEVAEERSVQSTRDGYDNSHIKCEKCILAFPNVNDQQDHIANKHDQNKNGFKCDICECTFANEVSYNYHRGKHVKRYQCVMCEERFPSKRAAIKHYEYYHTAVVEPYNCDMCNSSFSTEEDLDLHRELHQAVAGDVTSNSALDNDMSRTSSFSCEYCEKTFKWKTSLNKHVETHRIETGQKRKPYCEPCRLTFTTTSNLQKHVKTSSKHQIQLKLRKLNESLKEGDPTPASRQARIDEIRKTVNSNLNKYPCPHCDKRFQWKGNLLRHVRSHEAKARGQLVCEPCARSFSSIATYKQHMRVSRRHVSENDFKYMCADCGKKFANRTLLKDHVDWEHLKNYVHRCLDCLKVFKSHTSLYLHKRVVHRSNSGDHLCDHCGKPFPNHAKLRTHITAMHTSLQPYKCKICAASFSWHSCLSRHVKVVHHKIKVKRKKRVKEDSVTVGV